jgi:signal transduction histidine kinase
MTSSAASFGDPLQVAALLESRKEQVVEKWTRRVLEDPEVPEAERLPEPELRDHVPALIDRIVRLLRECATHGKGESAGRKLGHDHSAREHADQRAQNAYSLGATLRELSHLRVSIMDVCDDAGVVLARDTARLIHTAIDEGTKTAATEIAHIVRIANDEAAEVVQREAQFRERFIAILGHDLRQPLAGISFNANALLKQEALPEGHHRIIRRIATTAKRMSAMVDELLDFARSRPGGGIAIAPVATDLRDLVQRACEEAEAAFPDRTVNVSVDGDTRGEWDPARLGQVLANVIGNALTHSPRDTLVTARLRDLGPRVVFEVTNANLGAPIPAEAIPSLFDPFRRGAQVSTDPRSKGLGLGLFIAREIVQAHGGAIRATSGPDGTTFVVDLPRRR